MTNLKIAKQVPFNVLLKRVFKRVFFSKKNDYKNQELRCFESSYTLVSLLNTEDFSGRVKQQITTQYLAHKFDLLGSGMVNRGMTKELYLHSIHQVFSQKISKLITEDYQFIDWQKDIRSGFSFQVDKAFNDQFIDQSKNVDIKNCWELGRLQHLPQLAIAAMNSESKAVLLKEFKNQSLDFIASNPIGMGVQWVCAMDVGIRIANWLVAYDIFKQNDVNNLLDDQFTAILTDSIYQHTLFIYKNLEHKEGAAGNHYLFNLLGILFATNYLSKKEETIAWQVFAEQEIEKEFRKQFFADGGNFEGSTSYHCLSVEAILYAAALILGNGKEFQSESVQLLGKAFKFIKDGLKPDGEMPQFGDNDSGRLFKFSQQNLFNYEALVSGLSTLFGEQSNNSHFEETIVGQLSKKKTIKVPLVAKKNKYQFSNINQHTQKPITTEIKFSENIKTEEIQFYSYPDFGLYIFKSANFYMAISSICNKDMHHSWGHVHNDKLSFELYVSDENLVSDPGTYTYSAFPEKRNLLRSAKAHHGIVVKGIDQNKEFGLFYLEREVECKVLEIGALSITLQAKYYGVKHTREFSILSNQVIITDYCNKPFTVNINKFQEYSPNYGSLEKLNQ